ncbi:MAG TPA: GtrA family protein [Rectinemataceae bacterium]|nr:GtrA family protein [Rectinemataceae bacterium]
METDARRSLPSKLGRFLVAGGLAFLVDFAVYWLLGLLIGRFWAKLSSFVAATVFSFVVNKTLTFGAKRVGASRIALFAAYYAMMTFVNPAINELAFGSLGAKLPAFVLTTAVCAVMNFSFMNLVIFREARRI